MAVEPNNLFLWHLFLSKHNKKESNHTKTNKILSDSPYQDQQNRV
jgi:hypothetical protein